MVSFMQGLSMAVVAGLLIMNVVSAELSLHSRRKDALYESTPRQPSRAHSPYSCEHLLTLMRLLTSVSGSRCLRFNSDQWTCLRRRTMSRSVDHRARLPQQGMHMPAAPDGRAKRIQKRRYLEAIAWDIHGVQSCKQDNRRPRAQ